MLLPNTTIWDTRIQAVDALLTASAGGRNEVYYLATVCQVSLDPPLLSVSPNPEYPICETISRAGYFGVHFLGESQGLLVDACRNVRRARPDKLADLELEHTFSDNGVPLLADCLSSVECRVERAWDSGDHRTFIGEIVGRTLGETTGPPHRFGGSQAPSRTLAKRVLCTTGLYDLLLLARGERKHGRGIEEGTARYVGKQTLWTETEGEADEAVTHLAPKPPGICLVGCGWWGQVHALNLKTLGPNVRRFFASRDSGRAREFASRFAGEALSGFEGALEDARVDAVLLALPHHLHASAAERALLRGKHVLVEKPLALELGDAERLVELAAQSGLTLAVAEQYRLSPLVRAARDIIGEGALGGIGLVQAGAAGVYRPEQSWKRDAVSMGGGVLLDVGVHYVDVLRYLFGEPDVAWAIQPPKFSDLMEGEDAVMTSFRFRDGPVANLVISWSGHRSREVPNFEIIGERGSLSLWFGRPYLVHSTPLPSDHWAARARNALPWRASRLVGRYMPRELNDRIPVESGDLIGGRAIIEDFVSAITTGSEPAVPGIEGLRDLRVILAAYRALETGTAQVLAPD